MPTDDDDAITKKNNMVIAVIVESFGGIGTRGVRMLKFTSRRAGDRKRGRDGTRYSRVCNSISYLTHHMRQISGAAVMTDAANIEKEIIKLKITHASRAQ